MKSSSSRYLVKAERPVPDARSLVPTCRIKVVVVRGTKSRRGRISWITEPGWDMKPGVPVRSGSKCSKRYFVWESPKTTVLAMVFGNFNMIVLVFNVVLPKSMAEYSDE